MTEPLIEAIELKKYFKSPKGMVHAVDNVSFRVERGKTLGVVGESGCGKSTLGRAVLRLLEPTSGRIIYGGSDITKLSRRKMDAMRSNMQLIFQDPYASLNPRMTVSELIAEALLVCKTCETKSERDSRVHELMDVVGLAQRLVNTYPHELDGGRRQRIGIARALAVNPEFIVCDEPVSALDVSIQAQILNLLMDLQEERGFTYMFITHDLSVVRHISDDIMVMYLGQCVERAPSKELFDNPMHSYTKALLSSIPKPSILPEDRLRRVIKGEVTSPINPKPGCRFAARCPNVCEDCMKYDVPLCEVSPNHFVACARI
ncbi:oligopeptide/dipeptide ABC transporter ATP-binding protein [Clostridium sp. 1001271st1 H5]|uniref:ABC transporter ATP-binding protein n=1 Tax=unclassified Clostridium TaxID=2614128 RepID=UPI001FAAE596